MEGTLGILLTTAFGIGLMHTLIGIDHTLPFVVLGRAQGWPLGRVLLVTGLCGLGHVLSSVLLAVLGIGLGVMVSRLEWIEAVRGSLSAWILILFGLAYAGWSFARRRRSYRFSHSHGEGVVHSHVHLGNHGHLPQEGDRNAGAITVWSLFIIFVLGPCEPLIPLLMVPAKDLGFASTFAVAMVFGLTTIGTMLGVVSLGYFGLRLSWSKRLEAHANTLAGLAISASGVAIQILGI